MSRSLRVGIVGARRVRQGLGPFLARDLTRLGAEVACVLGTSEATARAAAEDVERTSGVRPRALASADAFDDLDLEIACILTPAGTHAGFVERALERGRHVLVEKPFLWSPESDWRATVRSFEERFAERGLVLAENAQWPWVVPAFESLFGHSVQGAKRFEMGLSPSSAGVQMIGDALPHPLSVAQALRPDLEEVEQVRFHHPEPRVLGLTASLRGRAGTFELEALLQGTSDAHPREAWLAIDGERADRCVRPGDYALFLRHGARLVDLPDPMTERLRAFLGEVAAADGAPRVPDRRSSQRAGWLAALVERYQAEFGPEDRL